MTHLPNSDLRELDLDALADYAALCVAAIERVPGWLQSKDLVTARAHAWVLREDLPSLIADLRAAKAEIERLEKNNAQ